MGVLSFKLTPAYLKKLPTGYSSKGEVTFVYEPGEGGKRYRLSCKGDIFSKLNIPAGYPRIDPGNRIELKPGVYEPKPPARVKKEDAESLFYEGSGAFPELMKTKDPEKIKSAISKLKTAIDSGLLERDKEENAKNLLKRYEKLEKEARTK